MTRQSPEEAKMALTMNATRMPTTIIIWFIDAIGAANLGGGDLGQVERHRPAPRDPTAKPMMKRAATSTAALGAAAAPRAPTVKVIAAIMMSRRRPIRSASGPATQRRPWRRGAAPRPRRPA